MKSKKNMFEKLNIAVATATVGLAILALANFARADFRDFPGQRQAKVSSDIVIVKGADWAEFNRKIRQSGDEVRKEFVKEFNSMAIPLAQAGGDPAEIARVVAQILKSFDLMHEEQIERVGVGMDTSLGLKLKAAYQYLIDHNRIRDSKRKVVFMGNSALKSELAEATERGIRRDIDKYKMLLSQQEFYIIYGCFTILPNGREIQLSLTVEQVVSGETRSFSVDGSVDKVATGMAKKLFDFFEGNIYPDWKSPKGDLIWVQSAPGQEGGQTAGVAIDYCKSQGARLPYAKELILASQGTQYRSGGITAMQKGEVYLVADKQEDNDQLFYFPGRTWQTGGAPVMNDAGHPGLELEAKYWCVKGTISSEIATIEGFYKIMRKHKDNDKIVHAAEYILYRLHDLGTRDSYKYYVRSIFEAKAIFAEEGLNVKIPKSLMDEE